MALTTALGFHFDHLRNGAKVPITQDVIVADVALAKGDMVNNETGQADLAVTNDNALWGVVQETKSSMTTGTTTIEVITDAQAVYRVYDAVARVAGALLDISGATGAMTIAASNNNDIIVVADSTANENTLVMINHGEHVFN